MHKALRFGGKILLIGVGIRLAFGAYQLYAAASCVPDWMLHRCW